MLNATDGLPRTDYPRPQWKRPEWMSLNGKRGFAFDFGVSGEARGMANGGEYPREILVPFRPESELSGADIRISCQL